MSIIGSTLAARVVLQKFNIKVTNFGAKNVARTSLLWVQGKPHVDTCSNLQSYYLFNKHIIHFAIIPNRYKVKIQVVDESGSASLVLFDREALQLFQISAADLRDRVLLEVIISNIQFIEKKNLRIE